MLIPLALLVGLAAAFPSGFQASAPCKTGQQRNGHGQCFPFRKSTSSASQPTASVIPSGPFPWAPPGRGDVRSPCPALNSLANHYLIPHDGRSITVQNVSAAFKIGMNIDETLVASIAAGAIAQCSNVTKQTCTSFHLGMLAIPHSLEHDGSLSRGDFNYGKGNNRVFSAPIWNEVMDLWSNVSIVDVKLQKAARDLRFANANATDLPGWFQADYPSSYAEGSFIQSSFGDPVNGNARKDWVHYWFSQERLPFALGWKPTQRAEITGASMAAMIAKMIAA